MRGTMMDYPLTLSSLTDRASRLFANVEIVSRKPDRSLQRATYADLLSGADALARALVARGLQPGERVATLMWNHLEHTQAYFGVPAAGGVMHTLNLRLHPDDLAYIVNHAADRFVIVDDVLLPLWQRVAPKVSVEQVFVVSQTGAPAPAPYEGYAELLSSAPAGVALPTPSEQDPVGMCYTSGTTGRPKGVVYTHRSTVLHAFAAAMADGLAVCNRDVVLPVVPQFHANAWGIPYVALMVGAKLVMPGPHLDAVSLLDAFESERVTVAAGVPTVWMAILTALDAEPERWKLTPDLRMVVGGSAAPEAMIRAFDRHRMRVVHAWGMTETSPLGSVANLKAPLLDAPLDAQYAARAKQGLPAPFVDIRAVSDRGEEPWDGQSQGELQVRGPWVASSYFNQEDAADRWTEDGWFRTGDVVTLDPHGYIKITDRTKDLIKSGGEWISSLDLENALMAHPAVAEAAVVAVPHPRWSERPLAAVVLRPGRSATAEELNAFLAGMVAKWWLPDRYEFIDAIPRTSTGKFLKQTLRDRYADAYADAN